MRCKKSILSFITFFFLSSNALAVPLRVMTYNIRRKGYEKQEQHEWSNRLPLVVNILQETNPDLIGLQEPITDQINDLVEALPHFSYCGTGRGSSWWGLAKDEYTPIFYNTSVLSLLSSETFFINTVDSLLGWLPWDAPFTGWLPRICTMAHFKINATDQEIIVYNTHLDHMYRAAQLSGIYTIMDHVRMQDPTIPVILMGDFNTEFKGAIKQICHPFIHVKEIATHKSGPDYTATGWYYDNYKWIDHILMRDTLTSPITVITHCVIPQSDVFASDHHPVYCDMAL